MEVHSFNRNLIQGLLILLFSISISAKAQIQLAAFFPDMVHATNVDTISNKDFKDKLTSHFNDFKQVLFDFGEEDSTEWSFFNDHLKEAPPFMAPRVNQLDVNKDGLSDLIVTSMGGHEFMRVGIYLGTQNGYRNIMFTVAEFFGLFKNGDLCLIRPACCDDPRALLYRVSVSTEGNVSRLDSLTIASLYNYKVPDQKEIFQHENWTISSDTLYANRVDSRKETYGAFLPGAEIRVIKTIVVKEEKLQFCEIKGQSISIKNGLKIYQHAFLWLSKTDFRKR
jgi:outer membrane protein assembly factor BamB